MSDIKKTIEAIRKTLPVNWLLFAARDNGTETRPFIAGDDLKELADGYESLQSENAELREALGHYAEPRNWICCQPSYLHNCREDKCWMTQYEGDGQGWDIAKAVLDKHKSKKS